MTIMLEDVIKLLLALVVGGVIGAEREVREKAAGFRTLMFISAGSTLFTIFSYKMAVEGDPNRIAAQIVSGVGFLGAGVILREGGQIKGLTTASMIWLVAALGLGIGGGHYLLSLTATGVVLFVLLFFPLIERKIENMVETHRYEVIIPYDLKKLKLIEKEFQQSGLRIRSRKRVKHGKYLVGVWVASGRPELHQGIADMLIRDPDIKEFQF